MSSLVSCLFRIRDPGAIPGAGRPQSAAGTGLPNHRPVLVDVEVDDGPLVAMLVHRIGLRLALPAAIR